MSKGRYECSGSVRIHGEHDGRVRVGEEGGPGGTLRHGICGGKQHESFRSYVPAKRKGGCCCGATTQSTNTRQLASLRKLPCADGASAPGIAITHFRQDWPVLVVTAVKKGTSREHRG